MKTGARKPRGIVTTVEINGLLHGPPHGNFQLSRGIMAEERRQIGYQGKHWVTRFYVNIYTTQAQNNHEVLNCF